MSDINVLIVEDDERLRELYKTAIELAGLTVMTAKNGEEGITMATGYHPDVILMDIMMPEMDGHEAVRNIRADEWGKDAKIIFLTNRTDSKNLVTAFEDGGDKYLVKSRVPIDEIVKEVKKALNNK